MKHRMNGVVIIIIIIIIIIEVANTARWEWSLAENTGCFKKSFTTLKAYRNLYRGHTQRFELSKYSKTHRVLPRIVMVQCDFHW